MTQVQVHTKVISSATKEDFRVSGFMEFGSFLDFGDDVRHDSDVILYFISFSLHSLLKPLLYKKSISEARLTLFAQFSFFLSFLVLRLSQ